ncbi:riboflavin synthase subunit beta, partial [mine drainage metagenome]
PVSLGISGPGETRLQAQARIESAKDAVQSVVKMIKRLSELKK